MGGSMHPAEVLAEQIGRAPGSLTALQIAYLQNIHTITKRRELTRRSAATWFTVGSGAYEASLFLAAQQESIDLTRAFNSYLDATKRYA